MLHTSNLRLTLFNISPFVIAQKARLYGVPDTYNPSFIHQFLEVKWLLGWGMFCYGSLDLPAAEVICRENRQEFALRIRKGTYSNYTGLSYSGNIKCTGDEMTVDDCDVTIKISLSCPNEHTIVDCGTGIY